MPGVVHFLDPYRYRSTFHRTNPDISEVDFTQDYLNHLEEIIQYEGPNTIAAILLESVTGTNGIIIPPAGYMQGVRDLCDKYNILLIADEVMSGFGRTGAWFAVDHWNVVPDLMTMAKGLTSGYLPLGAVVVSDVIARHFDNRMLYLGLTYCGHPMSCAAAVATLKIYSEENLIENSKTMGVVLGEGLEEIKKKHAIVGDVRYIGLFSVIELVEDRETKDPLDAGRMGAIKSTLLADGLTTFVNKNMVFICPPLCINQGELLTGLQIIDRAIATVEN